MYIGPASTTNKTVQTPTMKAAQQAAFFVLSLNRPDFREFVGKTICVGALPAPQYCFIINLAQGLCSKKNRLRIVFTDEVEAKRPANKYLQAERIYCIPLLILVNSRSVE